MEGSPCGGHLLPSSLTQLLAGLGPGHVGLSMGLLPHDVMSGFPHDGKQFTRKRERMPKAEVIVFVSSNPRLSPDHFCHILVFRSKSVSSVHTEGEGAPQGCGSGCSEVGVRGCLPHKVVFFVCILTRVI